MALTHRETWHAPIGAVRRGLPYCAFEELLIALGGSREELCQLVGLSARTLARRRAEGRFTPEESDRVARVRRVFDRVVDVLGGDEHARGWLNDPNRALGGDTPVGLLDTDVGTQVVLDLVGRIEHGIWS